MTYKVVIQDIRDKTMHRIGYLLTDGFQVLSLATQAVFEFANQVAEEPFYSVENFSPDGGMVRSSLGLALETRPLQAPGLADTWIVVGVNDPLKKVLHGISGNTQTRTPI